MIEKYLIGMAGIISLMVTWSAIQGLWRKTFSDQVQEDQDVLAGRSDCGNCSCATPCSAKEVNRKIKK